MNTGGFWVCTHDKKNPKYDSEPTEVGEKTPDKNISILKSYEKGQVVTKPWGREILLSKNEEYTFKRIEIKAGFETSLQYHNKKSETIVFLSGHARVVFEDIAGNLVYQDMFPGAVFDVKPPAVHRVVAITDISYVEASTPDPNGVDVIRLRDGHKRKDGRIENEYR